MLAAAQEGFAESAARVDDVQNTFPAIGRQGRDFNDAALKKIEPIDGFVYVEDKLAGSVVPDVQESRNLAKFPRLQTCKQAQAPQLRCGILRSGQESPVPSLRETRPPWTWSPGASGAATRTGDTPEREQPSNRT